MTIYDFLSQMEEEERVGATGCDTWGMRHLGEIGPAAAATLKELCPADLGAVLFGDDRGCDTAERSPRICKACTKRFLGLTLTKQMERQINDLR